MAKKILIVEDNQILCDTIASILQKEGYSVECSYNGKKGAKLVNSNIYDALIVDYKLPDISGDKILKDFLSNNTFPAAIMISAYADDDIIKYTTKENVLLLDKPFKNDELISALNSISSFSKAG